MEEVPSLLDLCAQFLAPRLTLRDLSVLPTEDLRETLQRHMGTEKQIKLFDEYKRWHDNGQLRTHYYYYKDGKQHGECKVWRENGQLRQHYHYKDGKMHGDFKSWHANGQLAYHKHYKNGKLHEVFAENLHRP